MSLVDSIYLALPANPAEMAPATPWVATVALVAMLLLSDELSLAVNGGTGNPWPTPTGRLGQMQAQRSCPEKG